MKFGNIFSAFVTGMVFVSPLFAAKAKLSELLQSGDPTMFAVTVRYSPPAFDFPSSANAKIELQKGGTSQQIIAKYKILDPVFAMTDGLADYLVREFHLAPRQAERVLVQSPDPKAIVQASKMTAGFILDLENKTWLTISEPGNSTNYIFTYNVELRLIDVKSQAVIRQGSYKWSSGHGVGLPYAERSLKDAAVFREELARCARDGIAYFMKKALSEKG